ncbi:MAG: BtrH N-terminal domain-containing protein [Clostridia bacterium]|nr:BtrH N-terminal domain-containing protein [Clostridia bacterium]
MSKKILSNIKHYKDIYSIDKVNCYEKPLGIVLDSFDSRFSGIFFMYTKLSSFCHKNSFLNNDILKDIIENKLELKFGIHQPTDFHSFIKENIDSQTCVLVPGNLKELYYTNHYRQADWDHLFLIIGYDDNKEIYYMMDGAHKDSYFYSEFVVQFDVLEKMYISYCEAFKTNNLYTIKSANNDKQVRILDLIIDCMDTFLSLEKGFSYKEIKYVDDILKRLEKQEYSEAADICNHLYRIINYKEVFYSELAYNTSFYLKNNDLVEKLTALSKLLATRWSNISNICSTNCFRKKCCTVSDELEEVTGLEKELEDTLLQIKKQLVRLSPEEDNYNKSGFIWVFENNEDNVISVSDSSCNFYLNKEKEYTCWLGDHAPKVFLRNFDSSSNSFEFTTRHTFSKSDPDIKFHGGIVFRDDSGSLYFWGNYCGECLLLEKIGENSKLDRVDIGGCDIILGLRKKGNTFYFEYSFSDESNMILAYEIDDICKIQQIGLGCKTWSAHGELKMEFNSIRWVK